MSDLQNKIPSFNEVMQADTSNSKVPSFADIMGEEPPKKKVSGISSLIGGVVGSGNGQSEENDDDVVKKSLQPYRDFQQKALADYETHLKSSQQGSTEAPSMPGFNSINQKKTELDKATKLLKDMESQADNLFPDQQSTINYLQEQYQKHDGKLPENNETIKLALQKVAKRNSIDEVAVNKNTFDDFATNLFEGKNAADISEAKAGEYINQALHDPDIINKSEKDGSFRKAYQIARANLYNNYPSFANKKMGTELGQIMEDNKMNGWLYSNPSVEKTDKAAKMLVDNGTWDSKEINYYNANIRPVVEAGHADRIIPLTDLAHKTGYSFHQGVESYNKSMRDIVNVVGGNFLDPSGNSLWQNLGLMQSEENAAKEAEQKQFSTASVEAQGNKRFLEKPLETVASVAPMILGGMAGVPQAANMVLMFESGNKDMAAKLYQGNDLKSRALRTEYTILGTTLDTYLMEFLPINKMLEARKALEPEIKKVITSLANGDIEQAAVKPTMLNAIQKYVSALPKEAIKTANVLTAYEYLHKGLNAASGSRNLQEEGDNKGFIDHYLTNLLAGSGLAALGALGAKAQQKPTLDGKVYQDYANNYDAVKGILDKRLKEHPEEADLIKEKSDNLLHLKNINDELNKRVDVNGNQKYNDEQKQKYLSLSLKKKVAEENAKNTPDKSLVDKEEIERAELGQKAILSGKNPDEVKTDNDIKLERLHEDNAVDNKKFDEQQKDIDNQLNELDGRTPENRPKIKALETKSEELKTKRERANSDYQRNVEKITPPSKELSTTSEEPLLKKEEPITTVKGDETASPVSVGGDGSGGDVSKQQKINNLMDDVTAFNKLPKNYQGRRTELNAIKVRADELGLRFDDTRGRLFNEKGKRVMKVSADKPSSISPDFNEADYSPETKKHIETISNNTEALLGLPIIGNDGRQLSRSQMEGALKSVKDGKPSRSAKSIHDFIEDAVQSGDIELYDKVTGQNVKVPVNEYFEAFKEPVKELTDAEILQLNFELNEDSFNFNDEFYGQERLLEETQQPSAEGTKQGQKKTGGGTESAATRTEAEERLKAAQSEHDKATAALKKAEDKISAKQVGQPGIFDKEAMAMQKEMFADRDNLKAALDPLRKKVKETKTELDAAQKSVDNDIEQPKLALNETTQQPTTDTKSVSSKEEGNTTQLIDKEIKAAEDGTGTPPPENGTGTGGGDNGGITHAANEVRRQDRLLPEYEKTPQSFEEWNNEAEKKIKDGYDVEKLMDKIEKGHDPDPVENAIRKIYIATLDAEIAKNPTDALLAKQKRFIEIGDLANSRAGRNLVSLKGEGSPLSSISDFYVAAMEAKNVDKLTEAEKAEVQKDYEEVKAARDKADKIAQDATAKFEEMKAENELLKQQLAAKNKNKSDKVYTEGKRDFKAEIRNYKDDLIAAREEHLKWLKDNGIQKASFGGDKLILTGKMAKIILKIAATHVEQVGVKIAEVAKRTWEDIKDVMPGLTEKDIMEVFSGKYNEKKLTKNEIVAQMRELNSEAKLLTEYDNLLNRSEPKEEGKKQKRNQRLTDIRKQIDALNKERGTGKYSDEAIAKRAIESNKRRKAEFERKLKEGDFEKEKQPVSIYDSPQFRNKNPKLYNELLDSQNEAHDSQLRFEKKLVEEEMKKWGLGDKARDWARKFSGTLKTLFASFDASAIAIQNLPFIATNPRIGAEGVVRSYKGFLKQKAFDRYLGQIHKSPDWPMVRECIRITEPKSLLASGREEFFPDRFKAIVTIKGKQYGWIKVGDGKYELMDISKPFERQFTMLGNILRVTKFRTEAAKLYEKGLTWEKNPEEFKTLGKRINNLSSSSDIPAAYQNEVTRTFIWSTRLMAAKLNMLGISDIAAMIPGLGVKKGYYRSLGIKGQRISRQQMYAVADVAKFAVSVVTASYLFALAKGGTLNTDPDDTGFLDVEYKAKDGSKKSMNFTGGFSRVISLIFQMVEGGKRKNGVFKKYGGWSDPVKEAGRFVAGKAPPLTRTALNVAAGKDMGGQKADIATEASNYKMPLAIGQIYKQVERDGLGTLFTEGLLMYIGVNSKDSRDYPPPKDKTITIKDITGLKERQSTPEEYKQYQEKSQKQYETELSKYETGEEEVPISMVVSEKFPKGKPLVSIESENWAGDTKPYKDLDEETKKYFQKILKTSISSKIRAEMNIEEE